MRSRPGEPANPHLRVWVGPVLAFVVLFGAAGPAWAQLSAERLQLHLASFDEVRSTIEARYPHEEKLDAAWHSRADSLREAVTRAASDEEVRSTLQTLALSFGESHFAIIPAEAYGGLYEREHRGSDEAASADSSGTGDDPDEEELAEGSVGIEPRWFGPDEGVVVFRVHEGSPADTAGIVPGDRVVSVNGRPVQDLVELVLAQEASVSRPETNIAIAVQSRLCGGTGDEVRIVRVDARGDTVETDLPIEPWRGVPTRLGALPEQTVDTYARDLGEAGVIGFNFFLAPGTVMPFFQQEMERFRDKPGIILDLRGNHGGLLPMIQGITGWFVDQPSQLGRMKMRGVDLKLMANPRSWTYRGKLAILTDEVSVSAAELFTAGAQELGIARVFGHRTAGLALPANVIKLANGDGFLFVVADYTTVEGTRLEQRGVVPDVEVDVDRAALYRDPDPVMSSALAWIRGEIDAPRVD